ncbi:hypothetical protein BH09SUM1_BH09SUM1_22320 [soil metagenome]
MGNLSGQRLQWDPKQNTNAVEILSSFLLHPSSFQWQLIRAMSWGVI